MKKIFLLLTIIFPIEVYASQWQNTTPGSQSFDHTIGPLDRSVKSTQYYIFKDHVAGYLTGSSTYDRIIFLCYSSSNPVNGACPTAERGKLTQGTTTITLQFTEKRSGIKRELSLIGGRKTLFDGVVCTNKYYVLNSHTYNCNGKLGVGTSLGLYIPAGEINKLPFGGVWEATLIFKLKRYSGAVYGNYTVNIKIDLTDKGNIQVWLPGFHSDPRVDLNLRPVGKGGYIGSNSLDMCFYDGYSTNSNSMEIKFQDDNPTQQNEYNLHKTGDTTKTLPYTVSFLLGGKTFSPVNGEVFTISDSRILETNWNRITAVSMPEINVPVLCWPARLLLNANVTNPEAGQYSGRINITFTPSSKNL